MTGESNLAVPRVDDDGIAIIGLSCRLPQAPDPEAFWRLLSEGHSGISELPADRFDDDARLGGTGTPAERGARYGGFLDQVDRFDPGFFGISPREALAMDPQQRLALELTWEALEDAAVVAADLHGTRTGVFVGAIWSDYANLLHRRGADTVTQHTLTGVSRGVIANRVSYTFGLHGPSLTVDAAQASSLVAVHMACESLRRGESEVAVAGGVNLILAPESTLASAKFGGLSPDGRCFTFDARANGYVRGEGGAVIVLKPLAAALADGDTVHAVIRGSAVNNDGATDGLTVPGKDTQADVIRRACREARVDAADVQYVELHGTGTKVGDPIEAAALGASLGAAHAPEAPLAVGSVKTNVGHLEGAAGIVGLLKTVLSIKHRQLPPSLNFETPNPDIDLDALRLTVRSGLGAWPRDDAPLIAGVSSFGMGGTNCHLVVSEPPADTAPAAAPPTAPQSGGAPVPWTLSGRTRTALRAQARRLHTWLETHPDTDDGDLAWSLATTRTAFEHRAVVLGRDRADLLDGLTALARDKDAPALVRGTAGATGGTVFVFPGQGSQWAGMAVDLIDTSEVFRAEIQACADALAPYVDWSLLDVLRGAEDSPSLERVDVVQPTLFAVMVSLARLWRSLGVEPDAVVGHSQGEIAAAYVAGALSLQDAARIVSLRSAAIADLAGSGGMAAVSLPAAQVTDRLERWNGRLTVAAVNGPASTIVSGDPQALDELLAGCEADGVWARRIPVDYASHSPHVEAVRDELLQALADVAPRSSDIAFYSTVTGDVLDAAALDADYWYRNLRHTVEFERATRALAAAGHTTFIEVSPHPVLANGLHETLESALDGNAATAPVVVGTLRRDEDGPQSLLTSLAQVHTRGVAVSWPALFAGRSPRRTLLPTYAFQRRRYWPEPPPTAPAAGPARSAAPADAAFWTAVESGDLDALAAELELPEEQRQSLDSLLPVLGSWRRDRSGDTALDGFRYRLTWRPVSADAETELNGTWLLLVPAARADTDAVTSLAAALAAHGAGVTAVPVTDAADAGQALARHLGDPATGATGVLSLLALDEDLDPGKALDSVLDAMDTAGATVPLWTATYGAVTAAHTDAAPSHVRSRTWGLCLAAEHARPALRSGLVDLPVSATEPGPLDSRTAARLCAVLAGIDGEDRVAIRDTGIFARRLVPAPRPAHPGGTPWRPRGTVLVAGAADAFGPHLARRLARTGTPHLLLTGSPDGIDVLHGLADELTADGTAVTVSTADLADHDQVRALLSGIPAEHPLTAVVHADGPTDAATALSLDELTHDLDLDAFVVLPPLAGIVGDALGDTTHRNGAAHATVLDALVQRRRAQGRAATAIAWGGSRPLAPELITAAVEQALADDEAALAIADIDASAVRPVPLLEDVPDVRAILDLRRAAEHAAPAAAGSDSPWAQRLAVLGEADQQQALLELVRGNAAIVLGHDSPGTVDVDRTFKDLGLDSTAAVELRNRLNTATGLQLPAALLYNYPTPLGLVRFLRSRLLGEGPVAADTAVEAGDEPIAIVGIGCRFPGGVSSPEELWQLVADGVDAIGPFPANRGWNLGSLYDPDPDVSGKTYAREGGFLHDADLFDADFFGISPREAVAMDPQQRLLLETAWEAIERVGIDPARLHGSRTGVFVGSMAPDYGPRLQDAPEGYGGYLLTGINPSISSGRIAYSFGFEGPAVTVDTACSSSLVALHLAAQALRNGECTMALAGGVTVMATPGMFLEFSRQRGLAPDGRCKSFADSADGTAWAEGAGMLLLERLSDAQANGHRVLALVRGSAVNQDGASNGLTAPNGPSQERVIRQALAGAGLKPGEVDAVEAHGTGTKLGDPIEAQALLATYGKDRPADQPLWLGSLKSNIGHAQAAAGVGGVIKMVQAMQHGLLPKTLHVDAPSPHVDWEAGAVSLLTEATPWPQSDRPRRAGVSSFGISGTNAHIILEQAPEPASVEAPPAPPVVPWVLSGKTEQAVRDQAARLAAHVTSHPDQDITRIAHALATTRTHFDHRAATTGTTQSELLTGLHAIADGTTTVSTTSGGTGKIAFLFTGQGSQRNGMGRELHDTFPTFAAALDNVCDHFTPHLQHPLRDVMFAPAGTELGDLLHQTAYTQPALFALETALHTLIRTWDIHPDYLT
ncbi:beta-ketoacyl synthase N-terminal-like domain-containing protein, partial [Kitasatospora sp. NPDC004723]|uniref:beta-ketoacyl synthase N-terminal-like domain-containing protein n=1 Tax=Kitasatospora sp. NPDC004723 TaxID=3154288 RepID=UPI0033A03EE9